MYFDNNAPPTFIFRSTAGGRFWSSLYLCLPLDPIYTAVLSQFKIFDSTLRDLPCPDRRGLLAMMAGKTGGAADSKESLSFLTFSSTAVPPFSISFPSTVSSACPVLYSFRFWWSVWVRSMIASIRTAVSAMHYGRMVTPPSIVPPIPPHHRMCLLYSLMECSICFAHLVGDHTTPKFPQVIARTVESFIGRCCALFMVINQCLWHLLIF